MKPILQNLVEMTGHRDHLRLEVSVLSTLQVLSSIVQVRSLEVFTKDGETFMRPRTWMENGQWVSAEAEAATDRHSQAIAQIPSLHECIQSNSAHAIATLGKGRYCMWLPLWVQDKVTSCLEVVQSRPFSSQKIDIITSVFHVYKNYQSLLDYSERDALTGLFNRKTFDEQFSRFTAPDAYERPQALSAGPDNDDASGPDATNQWLAVVDIDHFKQVNDRFGHLYGDEVLILVANILRTSFRNHDRIFRFGGEEFVVLLRSTSLSTAHKVFNRFRKNVEDYYFPQVGQVTVSVGFVSTTQGSPVEILGQADQALYFAKENGRNQVRYYADLIAEGRLQAKVSNDDVELF